jgi:hypothetical protein
MLPNAPPIAHYDYDELEEKGRECTCALCENYRTTFAIYDEYRIMCRGHERSCSCYLCTQKNEVQISYLAALSQRDTYCELSYLTVGHSRKKLAPQFLGWLYSRMTDPTYRSEKWWAIKGPCKSLAEWMIEWQIANLPRHLWNVSGVY